MFQNLINKIKFQLYPFAFAINILEWQGKSHLSRIIIKWVEMNFYWERTERLMKNCKNSTIAIILLHKK
jgi:hypothetical protein